MKQSTYENHARCIHGAKFKKGQRQPPTDITQEEYWLRNVKSKKDVEEFYALYYPELPEAMATALSIFIEKQVKGEIAPSDDFYKYSQKNQEVKKQLWDYKEELERERQLGRENLERQRNNERGKNKELTEEKETLLV